MFERLRRYLPDHESLRNNRWLRWLAPWLGHARLWHMSRKGIAIGLALGLFFGLLIPVAQIPFSATGAVLLRANVPVAVASTLVTNPVTFAPVYYGAYRLGSWILRHDLPSDKKLDHLIQRNAQAHQQSSQLNFWEQIKAGLGSLRKIGKPLFLGLLILATLAGFSAYFLVHWLWIWRVRRRRGQRLRKMRAAL